MRFNLGYFPVDRNITISDRSNIFYQKPILLSVYVTLCGWSNYKDKGRIRTGELLTSYKELSEFLGLSYAQVRSCLKTLITKNIILKLSSQNGLHLKVLVYQGLAGVLTGRRQGNDREIDRGNAYSPNDYSESLTGHLTGVGTKPDQKNDNTVERNINNKRKDITTNIHTDSTDSIYDQSQTVPVGNVGVGECNFLVDNKILTENTIGLLKNIGIKKKEDLDMLATVGHTLNLSPQTIELTALELSQKIKSGFRPRSVVKYFEGWLKKQLPEVTEIEEPEPQPEEKPKPKEMPQEFIDWYKVEYGRDPRSNNSFYPNFKE